MLGLGLSSKPICSSNGRRSADSARFVTVVLLLRAIAAGALCATLMDTAQAGPDPCTGIGTVTCSGNQSAGVANPSPGTTILNINSLTSDIMPTNGQPGIMFESSSDITVNSDTRPYVINSVATQFEIIPGIVVSNEPVGIFLSSTGAITLTSSGNTSVVGDDGVGIFASSSGGAVTIELSGNISVAGSGGSGINVSSGLGAVSVASSGDITITGNEGLAIGINAQSNGGAVSVASSGNISISGNAGFGAGIGAELNGGTATVASSGNISVAGSGGSGINVSGTGVGVTSSGNINASGNGSAAIVAVATNGDVVVKITGGTITGGSGSGAGVVLIAGGNNTLTNIGTITTSSGLAGNAILGTPLFSFPPLMLFVGNNTVNNAGIIIGNVDLGPGRNAFNNLIGGTFNPGATVNLGARNTLNNAGNLSPGGIGVIQTTALTGNLVQGGSGKITVDLNPASGQADRINVSGTANLGGQAAINLTKATPSVGATASTIVHADGGVTNNGVALTEPAVAVYQLEFPDPNDVVLQGGLDFAPAGLNRNQTAIGQNVNAIQLAAGSAAFLPVAQALLTIPDLVSLGQAYDQLSPETYVDNEIADFYSGLRFASALMSCNVPDGRYAFIKEGQCIWAQIGGNFLDLNAGSGGLGFSESAVRASGGAEVRLQPDWFAGFALGYEHGNEETGNALAQSRAARANFGAVVKYNPGPFLFAAAAYGGYGWYTTDRFMDFGSFNGTAGADSRVSRVGGQLQAAYLVDRGLWYLKPTIDLNVTGISFNGFSEQGAGGASLVISGGSHTVFSGSPAVEIGTQMNLPNYALLRQFARIGMTAFSNTDFGASAMFSGAPPGVAPFRVTTAIDSVAADVAAGADFLLSQNGLGLKLAYNGHYGARIRDQGVRLKASVRF